jgi:formiminoglutamase
MSIHNREAGKAEARMTDWLTVTPGDAPLIVAFPHTGTEIPAAIEARMADPWRARKDADWWIDRLYAFAGELGATTVRTAISRSVIDVNRDPSGQSLYPGMTTTGLCPTETFDGEPLYRPGQEPDAAEIEARRAEFFDPYHAALTAQIERLSAGGPAVLYDAHSIRSHVPRLFDGELPQFNIGDNGGATCAPALTRAVEAACIASGDSHVVNGRFKGGWTTRHYGWPETGVHAIQMELACRGYIDEPAEVGPATWPASFDTARAAPITRTLRDVLTACRDFAFSQRA